MNEKETIKLKITPKAGEKLELSQVTKILKSFDRLIKTLGGKDAKVEVVGMEWIDDEPKEPTE